MRVSLVWSHPDAGLSLWTAHPGQPLSRPTDLWPEFGIEAFDVEDAETAPYRIEVRRSGRDLRMTVDAELVIVWNEGQGDEQIAVVPLRFEGQRRVFAWTIEGQEVRETEVALAVAEEVQ